ncbi:LLM class F420-dependent oxidoreductase [Rhodococcus sp. NPDC004095]
MSTDLAGAAAETSAPRTLRIDGGIPNRLAEVPAKAAELERRGYDGCWVGETNHDPFLPLVLAAEHTERLSLGTNIAVAFARNPMAIAGLAWDLQDYSRGRFCLGLGTQIRPHVEKRFSMPWSRPVGRMREFVDALHAIWSCWRDGTPLRFEGEFYTHKIMTPMFTPEPSAQPTPRILLAAVGEAMTGLCGEIADGLLVHPFGTRRYVEEVTRPTVDGGLERSGRTRDEFELAGPVFVVTGEDEAEYAAVAAAVRRQIAFYGSTPAYRGVLDLHGWGDLHTELHTLSKQGDWEAMAGLIDDEMLETIAVVGQVDEIPALLRRRCEGLYDRVVPGLPKSLSGSAIDRILVGLR